MLNKKKCPYYLNIVENNADKTVTCISCGKDSANRDDYNLK